MSEYLSEQRPPAPMISSEEYHAAFTAEKRDETWADFIEAKLRDYFARQRDADHFAIVSLGCRSSLCEVLAVSRSPQSAPVDADRWQDIVHQMRREAWYASSEIREPEVTISVTKDGRALLLTHLVRK